MLLKDPKIDRTNLGFARVAGAGKQLVCTISTARNIHWSAQMPFYTAFRRWRALHHRLGRLFPTIHFSVSHFYLALPIDVDLHFAESYRVILSCAALVLGFGCPP